MVVSTKSAGSTALQSLLVNAGGRTVDWTPHQENETLFWVKAASILGRPQVNMADSVVPYAPDAAERELRIFLERNVPALRQPRDPEQLVREGWRALISEFGPIFVEKSPHHLHQWSALKLAMEVCSSMSDVDLRIVGLVRNPMDTLYSMWQRWGYRPSIHQFEWLLAYENLVRLQDVAPRQTHIVTYEELVSDPHAVESIGSFVGLRLDPASLRSSSVDAWRNDRRWGHELAPAVQKLASAFGYTNCPTPSPTRRLRWYVNREFRLASRQARQSLVSLSRRLGRSRANPRP